LIVAARIRKTHQDEIRSKIQVSQLLNRVHKYALGELSDEEVSSNRLNAIKLLLSKALPDLSSVEITGDAENPVAVKHLYEWDEPK
jgi:hypothetical protein